jgi:superfamily II DNA or RNA helicase
MAKTPSDIQNECITALKRDLASGLNRLAIVLPTGTGKGFVIAMCAATFAAGKRVLVLANSGKLMKQIEDDIRELLPQASIGWVKAGRNEVHADIVIASVASMSEKRCHEITNVGLLLGDETHYAVAPSWMRVFAHFGCFEDRGTPYIGFTATLVRNDEKGMGDLFQKVSLQRDLEWAIKHKYVLPFRRVDVVMPSLDLRNVPQDEEGEYDQEAIGAMLAEPSAGRFIARTFKEYAKGKRGIVYAPSKKAAHALGEFFTEAGITNAVITGDTPEDEREEIYEAARRGEIQALINVGVLIAGFDDQGIWLVLVCTMTKAQSRLTQIAGRAMRVDRNDRTKVEGLVVVMKGVEAQIATIVELKRTGAKKPVRTASAKRATQAKIPAAALTGQYKTRRDGSHMVTWRMDGGEWRLVDRRPMPGKDAKEIAAKIIRLDQLQRYVKR